MHKDLGVAILSVTASNISCFRLVPGLPIASSSVVKAFSVCPQGPARPVSVTVYLLGNVLGWMGGQGGTPLTFFI